MKNAQGRAAMLQLSQLRPFEGHPYKVLDNEEMEALTESIRASGILAPLIVRPLEDTENGYEIISGHRRFHAAQKAGITEIPVRIYDMDRDTAAIMLVDSNLHREHILPSEKAFAYKLKMEALAHQGKRTDLTSCQVGTKLRTDESMAEDCEDSARQIQRYIRLTYLIPELLGYMDAGKMALSVGVELSYLSEPCQRDLLELCQVNDCTPSYSQAFRLKNLYRDRQLTQGTLTQIMNEEKANQREKISFPMEDLRRYFPAGYTPQEMQRTILRLLENERQRRQRCRDDGMER